MNEGISWLLLTMLVSLSRGNECHDRGNCSCRVLDKWEWEIRCPGDSSPKVIARIDHVVQIYRVNCQNAASWSEFEFHWTLLTPVTNRATITIEGCPLPDESFGYLAKRLGSKFTEILTFSSHMNLSSLTRQHLSMLSELQTLSLQSNGLTELPSDLFRDVGDLRQLDLSFNRITTLPRDIFHGLSLLWEIDLSDNAMENVDWRLFDNCTELRSLSLRGNFLTSLDPRTFLKTKWLTHISLAENLLETLPPGAFDYAKGLVLDISGNRFSTLPESLFSQTKLTEITLRENRGNLKTLPMNFLNNLTRLERVILIRNNLTSLRENIFFGSFSIQSIDLYGNGLTTLPKDIFRDSRALISLDLSENSLNHLPEGLFSVLSNLQELQLASNGIASLSENVFRHLDSLVELNLEFNNITDIHWATFRTLPNIRRIRLSYNSVNLADPDILRLEKYFGGSTILEIFLDHNNLKGSFIIEPLDHNLTTNLHFVDLSYNQISYVQVSSPLIGSRDVSYDLRHNNLSIINVSCEIFSKVKIFVDDNPLDCGCTIYEWLEYMLEFRKQQSGENVDIILGNATCSEPEWMKGTPVASLQLETFSCYPEDYNHHVRCAEGCVCRWRPDDETRIVNCSSRNIRTMPNETIEMTRDDDSQGHLMLNALVKRQNRCFNWRNTPVELDLGNNSLTKIRSLNVVTYKYVETLILSHNKISDLLLLDLPPKLKNLHLEHNHLKILEWPNWNTLMNLATLRELNLEENPWSCDSETRLALDSMKDKLGLNLRYSTMKCLDNRNPPNMKKKNTLYISYTIF